jgi:hypothetical protein
MKAIKAADDLGAEKPDAPARANPKNTTFPVMLAVNTWPKPRRLTASTIPVTAVMARRMYGDTAGAEAGRFIS